MATRGSGVKSTGQYKYVGYHAAEVQKADGTRPWVGPGDYIDLDQTDLDDPANEWLKDSFIEASGVTPEAEAAPAQQEAQPAESTTTS